MKPSLIYRRALRTAIIVFISVLIYRHFSLTQGYWITLTAMIVAQATVGATLRKGIQRFLGTLLGITIASFFLLTIHNTHVIDALLIICIGATYFFKPFSPLINYGVMVVPLSIMIVFFMALITPDTGSLNIIYARLYDTTLGAMIGILGSLIFFPNRTKHELSENKEKVICHLIDYFDAILDLTKQKPNSARKANTQKACLENILLNHRQFYLERRYEKYLGLSHIETELKFMREIEGTAERLFVLHYLAKQLTPIETKRSGQNSRQWS